MTPTFEEIADSYGTVHVVITSDDGSTISMPKSVYDELQAQQAANNTALEG